jgi:hypothetical protein
VRVALPGIVMISIWTIEAGAWGRAPRLEAPAKHGAGSDSALVPDLPLRDHVAQERGGGGPGGRGPPDAGQPRQRSGGRTQLMGANGGGAPALRGAAPRAAAASADARSTPGSPAGATLPAPLPSGACAGEGPGRRCVRRGAASKGTDERRRHSGGQPTEPSPPATCGRAECPTMANSAGASPRAIRARAPSWLWVCDRRFDRPAVSPPATLRASAGPGRVAVDAQENDKHGARQVFACKCVSRGALPARYPRACAPACGWVTPGVIRQ